MRRSLIKRNPKKDVKNILESKFLQSGRKREKGRGREHIEKTARIKRKGEGGRKEYPEQITSIKHA